MNISHTVYNFFAAMTSKILSIIKNFFINTFEIKSTKRSKIVGSSIAGVLLLAVVFFNNQFTSLDNRYKWLLFAFALIAPLIIGVYIAFTVKIKNDLFDKIWPFLFFMLSPIITMTMTECLNNIFIYNMTYLGFLGNYVVILIF